jgi:CO/xanthine dehydrogenase FAD-binding subunit
MAFSQRQLSIFTPRTLRDALHLSFSYREQVRWLIGTSPLLALAYTHVPSGAQIVDVRRLQEFRAPALGDETRARFGAFATEEALRGHPVLERGPLAASSAPLYLMVSDASVEVISLGHTRRAPIDALVLASHEAPVAIELHARDDEVYVERRRSVTDGAASHDLLVAAAFRLDGEGRTKGARIGMVVNGGRPIRARLAEHHLAHQRLAGDRMETAARLCAAAIEGADPQAAAAARSALTLALALFKDARVRCEGDANDRDLRRESPRRSAK